MDDRVGAEALRETESGPGSPTSTASARPVTLPADTLAAYERFSLYNSPYPAHDRGCAIDLYPETNVAPSPVAGVVRDTRTVDCPPKPYAVDRDHLILVDVDAAASGLGAGVDAEGLVARVLHVDPAVEPGDEVAVGDPLGEMVRSGFFGQWVANHVHLGFRGPDANPYRASGSLPVSVGVDVAPVPWDGTGTVVETGPTHALLDAPGHPRAGGEGPSTDDDAPTFAAVADDAGRALDGGLAHYSPGGLLSGFGGENGGDAADVDGADGATAATPATVSLLGCEVGVARGRDVVWGDIALSGNGDPLVGLSLFAARDDLGVKLVAFDHAFAVGDEVTVTVEPTDDPVRLD